jgi:hypothetical protein
MIKTRLNPAARGRGGRVLEGDIAAAGKLRYSGRLWYGATKSLPAVMGQVRSVCLS